jgi:hypothetical protein
MARIRLLRGGLRDGRIKYGIRIFKALTSIREHVMITVDSLTV